MFVILHCNVICQHLLIHMQSAHFFPIDVSFLYFLSSGCQLRALELIICLQQSRLKDFVSLELDLAICPSNFRSLNMVHWSVTLTHIVGCTHCIASTHTFNYVRQKFKSCRTCKHSLHSPLYLLGAKVSYIRNDCYNRYRSSISELYKYCISVNIPFLTKNCVLTFGVKTLLWISI
jgi:hypothetical protein